MPVAGDLPVLVTVHLARLYRDSSLKLATQADWAKVSRILRGTWPRRPPSFYYGPVEDWDKLPPAWAFDTEYVVEMAIPWAQVGVTPFAGLFVGLDLTVMDSDPGSPNPLDYFDWAQIAPASFAQPVLWKRVQLVDSTPAPPAPRDTTAPAVTITSPAAGSVARSQRSIRVWLSAGAHAAIVPQLVGETERAAQMRVLQDGLALGAVAEIRSSSYPPDVVVDQVPAAKTPTSQVSLLVNRADAGASYVMPDLIGLHGDRAAEMKGDDTVGYGPHQGDVVIDHQQRRPGLVSYPLQQRRQRLRQRAAADADRSGDAQLTHQRVPQFRQPLLRLLRLLQHRLAAGIKRRPRLGQRQTAGGAVQQRHPERLLQRAHMLTDRRRRHAQPPRRTDQRSLRHHGGEHRHSIEFIHDYEVLLNQESMNMALITAIVKD